MIQKPTIAKVRDMLAESSRIPASSITATWSKRPRLVTGPTGHTWYQATATVSAPGHRTRDMIVTADDHGTMVR